jgi:stage II sporulation protein D
MGRKGGAVKRVAVFLATAVWCGAYGRAQMREPDARLVTVEAFSTHKISSLAIEPVGTTDSVKLCAVCRAKSMRKSLTATLRGEQIVLSAGERVREVELNGTFRLNPNGDTKPVSAAGVWRLAVVHGEIRVLLTLDSERYVAMALKGEAGPSEPIESLKAMAVVVRTFALENGHRHRGQGFDLCDSTHCQALKFGSPSPLVERAVLETAGETLWFGSRQAKVFYAQNCGGRSEAAGQVWAAVGASYLTSHVDPWCSRHGAAEWHAEIPMQQMQTVFRTEGWKVPAHIDEVRIAKRTDAGRAVRLEFAGEGVRVPIAAGSLRLAVGRALGWNQLRSDWYTVSLSNGVLYFNGRGYGHGVGLCQAGAVEMAREGHSAAEILNFYFPGTRLGITAEDRGWQSARGMGWTLWMTKSSPQLLREGNTTWGQAEALYRPRANVLPEVWEYPTTELFRQSTHEPGWMMASTRGLRVSLQPEPLLQRSGREEETLLHEFLHVLVESEASPQAPLWLREGLVEAVANGATVHGAGPVVKVEDVDTELKRPATQMESQQAHEEAARLVKILIARYGLEQVRNWLRTGIVPDFATKTAPASR